MTAQTMLQLGGNAGEYMIGRGGADDNQIDITRFETRCFQCPPGRLFGQIAGGFAGCGDVAFLHSSALDDPVRRSLDPLFEFSIGQHVRRQITAGSDDSGIVQSACLAA